jgi:hypothetical protein
MHVHGLVVLRNRPIGTNYGRSNKHSHNDDETIRSIDRSNGQCSVNQDERSILLQADSLLCNILYPVKKAQERATGPTLHQDPGIPTETGAQQ